MGYLDNTGLSYFWGKIKSAFGASLSVSGRTVTLKSKSGATLSTITTQDTTYSNATTSSNGLMSKDDKSKLDGIATGATKNSITQSTVTLKVSGWSTIVESVLVTLKKILSCSRFSQNMIEIYSEYPEEIRNFVVPLECSDEDFVNKWLEEKYVGKQIPETTATFTTNKGEQVRSKSELNIANALAAKGIPYKYECPLTLKGGNTIYPDFTVLNVKKRRVIYWEHRGMMDDRGYSRDAVERVKDMNRNGIILGKNLIITEETGNCPLNTTEIDAVINNYFL